MKLSRMGIKTQKNRMTNTELMSTQILIQAGLLHRYGAGVYGKHHFLVKAQANIEKVIREVLDKNNCIEVSLPILQPKDIWEQSKRWDLYALSGELFTTDNDKYCLAPTAEEAMLEFVRNSLTSHNDLPVTLYQIGSKFRNELRSHGGLLRSKEFTMMDAYSFHASEESLKQEYKKMRRAYLEIFQRLGLEVIPVAASNGNIGGKYSEEFMVLAESGQDTILVNGKEKNCIEVGHIFQLGQKYSTSMGATFKSASNEEIPFYMGCYGIGTSRVLAAICETNCDEEGLYLPMAIAPYKIMIVYTHDKKEAAFKVYRKLQDLNIPVIIDDRDDVRIGSKNKDWKLFGIPYLLFVGKNFNEQIFELESRKTGSRKFIPKDNILNFLNFS